MRATFETDDGATIYLSYYGILELSQRAVQAMSQGPATEYGEIKLIAQPRFETGDERYAWLNSTVCLAKDGCCRVPWSSTACRKFSWPLRRYPVPGAFVVLTRPRTGLVAKRADRRWYAALQESVSAVRG